MFKTSNPYDEVVAKATDEKQTVENWDILLTVWDKVNEDGEAGARNCVAALQKRLSHRSANVQLFSLTLADALVNNCGVPLHREISGKAFTQSLVRIVNDRTTHEDVKKRVLKLVEGWAKEYRKNPDFDLMVETYEALRSQNHRFNDEQPPAPSGPSDEVLRREEDDLQRALAESAALSDPLRGFQKSQPSHSHSHESSSRKNLPNEPEYNHNQRRPASPESYGFAPPATSSVVQGVDRRNDSRGGGGGRSSSQRYSQDEPREEDQGGGALRTNGTTQPQRVKALYDFNTETPEELPFRKGDVIRVLECVYEAWWRGELRGRVGIFPTVYVEEIVEPTPASLAQEAENEAALFAQSASIDKLLNMMRSLEGQSENLAENEDLLELYQQSMSLRPKVVKLIEKYNQKQTELRLMNEKFTRAKTTYDSMIEESMQRYSQPVYAPPPQQQQQYAQAVPPPQQQQQQYSTQQQQNQADAEAMAGWTPEQRREYDAQWAAYHAATQQYYAQQQQYYAQQGLPVPQGSQLPDVQQGTHYATQDPARLQQQPQQDPQGPPPTTTTTDQQQAQYYQQQQQQQQAPPTQVIQTPLPAPQSTTIPTQQLTAVSPIVDPAAPQPYWDAVSQQWLWPQQLPPPQSYTDRNLSSPTSPHPYAQVPTSTTAQSPPPNLQSQPSYSTAQTPYALVGQMEALSMEPTTSPSIPPLPQPYPSQPYPPQTQEEEPMYASPQHEVVASSPYPPVVEQAYYANQASPPTRVGQQVYAAAVPPEGYRY